TLASYLSMQPDPDTTESRGHLVSGALGGPPARVTVAVPSESATVMATMENQVFIRRHLLRDVLAGTMPDEGPLCPMSGSLPPFPLVFVPAAVGAPRCRQHAAIAATMPMVRVMGVLLS